MWCVTTPMDHHRAASDGHQFSYIYSVLITSCVSSSPLPSPPPPHTHQITATISETSLQLSGVANGYSAVFDPGNLDPYLFSLCSSVDEQVFSSSTRKCTHELTDIHSTALATIAGTYVPGCGSCVVGCSGVEWCGVQ